MSNIKKGINTVKGVFMIDSISNKSNNLDLTDLNIGSITSGDVPIITAANNNESIIFAGL